MFSLLIVEAICKKIFVISSIFEDSRNSLLFSRMMANGAITKDQLPKQKRRSRREYEKEGVKGCENKSTSHL